MPTSLTDKRRAALMQVSKFLAGLSIESDIDGVRALELAALTAKLSLPDNGALDFHEPMSEDICVTRGGVSVIAPASTPSSVLVALFSIAEVFGQCEMNLSDIVAHVRGAAESPADGYRAHSIALHQVFAALRGETDIPSDPYPDGAGVAKVIYRARVAIESMRATATALGQISKPPRTVGGDA